MDGRLFRYSINRKLAALEIIDIETGTPILEHVQHSIDSKFDVYQRDGASKKISQNATFSDITSTSPRSDPSVFVESDNDGHYLLTLGSKQVVDGGVMYAGAAFGLTGVMIYTMIGGLRHAADYKGIERYYYSVFDPLPNSLINLSADIRTKFRDGVDRYEQANSDLPAPQLQGYAENSRYVVGFYYRTGHNKRGENVQVVWFPR